MSTSTPKKAPDFLAYNLEGFCQVGATWELTIKQYKEAVMKIASQKIDDITDVQITPELDRGLVRTRLWFPNTSNHVNVPLIDTALPTRSLHRYSEEFLKFVKTYGYRKFDDDPVNRDDYFKVNEKLVIDWNTATRSTAGKDICVLVANYLFIGILFDIKGVAYKKQFPKSEYPDARTEPIDLRTEWVYTHDQNGRRKDLVALRVTKTFKNPLSGTGEPRASRAGKL